MMIRLEDALRPQIGGKLRLNGFTYSHGEMVGIVTAPNDRVAGGELRYRNELGVVAYDQERDEISLRVVDWLAISALRVVIDRAVLASIGLALESALFETPRSESRFCIIVDRSPVQQVAA